MIKILNKKNLNEDKLSVLETSLASLISPSMFIEEKFNTIEKIRKLYLSLEPKDKNRIDLWLKGRYKRFLELLVKYDKNIHNRIDFVNYSFRWGVGGVIAQDINFSNYLVEPIIEKKLFITEIISSYAFLTYGTIMFHYCRESTERVERDYYALKALNALTNSYNTAKNDYLKNRSSYFLSQLYSINSDFSSAVLWYFKSLDCTDLAHDQFTMLYTLLTRDIENDMALSFSQVNKVFKKENVQNRYFWMFIKSKVDNPIFIKHITKVVNLCTPKEAIKIVEWDNEVEVFFTTVNSYINQIVDNIDIEDSMELQELYFSPMLNNRGKAKVLFRMAVQQKYYSQDFSRSMLMASESNTLFFDSKKLHFMSSLILENFSSEVRRILVEQQTRFLNFSITLYCNEMDKKVVAWKRFVKRGCLSGRLDEEIEFLEFRHRYTNNDTLKQVLITRLAYLYFKGTGGVSEDGYEKPNYRKAKELFSLIKENPLVTKHLNHPKLSIYLDMEKMSPNSDGHYLLFEKRMSNKLLIVFSCAFSYSHYTQLREFYQRNKVNVLFINNPSLNWYHGSEWSRIESIMKQVVFKKFKKENITTYFGSMGGYGALRVGLTYGLKTIVFNPQIDLNLWIKHRPTIATRLNKEKLVHIQDFNTTAFEKTPLYMMSSSSIEDVEAFKILISKLAICKQGLFIIEKIPENIHAGIFGRVYSGDQQKAILNISELQDEYYPAKNYKRINYKISNEFLEIFWDFINTSMSLRVIIQIVNREIFCGSVEENFTVKPTLYPLEAQIEAFQNR